MADPTIADLLRIYGRDDLRDPALAPREPWPALPPLPPRASARNWLRPGSVTAPVEQDLAAALLAPYSIGRSGGELAENILHSQYAPAAASALELMLAAAPIPGMKGRASTARESALPTYGRTLPDQVLWAFNPHGEGKLWQSWPDNAPTLQGMSKTQRAKAEALGYDTSRTLYRGSYKKSDPVRRLKETAELAADDLAVGAPGEYPYFTDKPRIANHYASGELYDPHPVNMINNPPKAANITPAWALKDKVLIVPYNRPGHNVADLAALEKTLGHSFGKKDYDVYMEDIADVARRKGYNMVEFQGMSDWGGRQSQFLPLHPDAIRSPWAAFDPANARSGNFMGSIAAPAIAGPALAAVLAQYGRNGD